MKSNSFNSVQTKFDNCERNNGCFDFLFKRIKKRKIQRYNCEEGYSKIDQRSEIQRLYFNSLYNNIVVTNSINNLKAVLINCSCVNNTGLKNIDARKYREEQKTKSTITSARLPGGDNFTYNLIKPDIEKKIVLHDNTLSNNGRQNISTNSTYKKSNNFDPQTIQQSVKNTKRKFIKCMSNSLTTTVCRSRQTMREKIRCYFKKLFAANKPVFDKMSWNSYHPLSTIKNFLYEMERKYPHLVRVKCIGKTFENRSIRVLKISENMSWKDTIIIEAGIHAREWISPATATYVINKLLTEWSYLPEYLRNKTWIFLPVMNPDGYHYTWETNRMWRKNRQKIWRCECIGVDLNRNFDCAWEENPHNNPCHLNYRGPKPFSEKESQAVRDFLLPLKKYLKGYISLHSFGQDVRFHWNLNEKLPDLERVNEIATIGVKKMCRVNNVIYTVRQTPKKFIFGSSRDWIRKVFNIKYAYVIELRDRGKYGFLLPESEIIPNGNEVLEFIMTVAWAIEDDRQIEKRKEAIRKMNWDREMLKRKEIEIRE